MEVYEKNNLTYSIKLNFDINKNRSIKDYAQVDFLKNYVIIKLNI